MQFSFPQLPEATEQAHHGHRAPGFSEFPRGVMRRVWGRLREPGGTARRWPTPPAGPAEPDCRPPSSATHRDVSRFRPGQQRWRPRGNGSSPVRPTTRKCAPARENALSAGPRISVRAQYVPNGLGCLGEGARRAHPCRRSTYGVPPGRTVFLLDRAVDPGLATYAASQPCPSDLAWKSEPLADVCAAHAADCLGVADHDESVGCPRETNVEPLGCAFPASIFVDT